MTAAGGGPAALFAATMVLVAVLTIVPRRGRGIHRLAAGASTRSANAAEQAQLVGAVERRLLRCKGGSQLARTSATRLGVVCSVAAVAVAVGASMGAQLLVSLLAIAVVGVVVISQRARSRRRRTAAARRAQVIEACGILAADLRAGRTPQDALEGAATVCPDLQIAAAAARLGGDVAPALDLAAEPPGGAGLRALGAAWRVAEQSGAAFATIAERLAESLRADESLRRQVAAGLAGSRSTARLLAALPLFGTALGYGLGADPLAFLTGSPIGWLCLLAGLALAVLGLLWVERLAETCEGDR